MNDVIIDMNKPGAVETFRMLQMFYALRIESETGLRHSRGSVMNLARSEFGCQKRTKKGVMQELAVKLAERGMKVEV